MNSPKPFFSIIVPLYNKQEHIANTLYSVLHQTCPDFELLVINDGSTDGSVALVEMFDDPRLRIYHQKNAGVSAARNKGISCAKGQYIAFLDADDLWRSDYLAEMQKLIRKFPACGFYGAAHTVLQKHRSFIEGRTMPEGIVKNYFRDELLHHITRLSATVVNRVVFKKISGFPVGMISGEDSYFCACIARDFPVAYTPEPMVIYNKIFTGLAQRYDKVDSCREYWLELYAEGDFYRNELIAVKALRAGIRNALSLNLLKSKKIEKDFGYTALAKKELYFLYVLNRLPAPGIKLAGKVIFLKRMLVSFYQNLLAKKPAELQADLKPAPLEPVYSYNVNE